MQLVGVVLRESLVWEGHLVLRLWVDVPVAVGARVIQVDVGGGDAGLAVYYFVTGDQVGVVFLFF